LNWNPHPTTPHPQWLFLGFAIRVLKETSSSNPVLSPPTWETPNTTQFTTRNKGVCHTVALPFTLKSIIR
jgi:hypothetical protein